MLHGLIWYILPEGEVIVVVVAEEVVVVDEDGGEGEEGSLSPHISLLTSRLSGFSPRIATIFSTKSIF